MTNKSIGLIVEDETDFDSLSLIIPKISGKHKLSFQKKVADGKGKFKSKLSAWADLLGSRGCHAVIAIIDADTLNAGEISKIKSEYTNILNGAQLNKKILVVSVFELETWLLYDTNAIARAFDIKKKIKRIPNPEALINSKEKLRDLIESNTKEKKYFYSTNDNKKIAKLLDVSTLNSCGSFQSLKQFILTAL